MGRTEREEGKGQRLVGVGREKGRRMKGAKTRRGGREPREQRAEKIRMEREDGKEENANANAKWNGKNGGEGSGEEKIIAAVIVRTEWKCGESRCSGSNWREAEGNAE
jgi:hypothetical protein